MSNLPRNMKLKTFDPHRADFVCKHESAVNPPATPEAEALFQQGMAVTSYELIWPTDRRDYAKAAELWRDAASKGHWKAALNLAGLYETGQGVPRDTERAVLLVEALMQDGVPAAFDKMGTYHQRGIGVKADTSRAYAFWQLAADMGSSAAQAYLGPKLKAAYDSPDQGFWGNREVALKMLECSFAQGNGQAAYELAMTLNNIEEAHARALLIYHEGVKLGSMECARDLSVSFADPEPMTGNTIDRARVDRYRELSAALELNPDLRFPNLDKVLPLPPAELPFWDGKRETLIDAAKGLVPAKVLVRTPGSEHTGRAHIPDGWLLPEGDQPRPLQEEAAGHPSVYLGVPSQREHSQVKFTGYWLAQLRDEYSEREQRWNAAQLPQRYARGERFEPVRASLGSDKGLIQWHFMGVPYQRPVPGVHPMVAQGIARSARIPRPQEMCQGSQRCPLTGTWVGQVDPAHPGASAFNITGRQVYLQQGERFPDPAGLQLDIARHQVTWLWLDNANQRDAQGYAHVTLSDLHDERGRPLA